MSAAHDQPPLFPEQPRRVEDAGLYADGTGGWSGSATSRERALREEATGVRGRRSRAVYTLVTAAGAEGMTDPEVQTALVIGHGASSGALTRLHRDGFLARLAERRHRNEVYVHPDHVNGRPTVQYRPNTGAAHRQGLLEAARRLEARADRYEGLRAAQEDPLGTRAVRLAFTRDIVTREAEYLRAVASGLDDA